MQTGDILLLPIVNDAIPTPGTELANVQTRCTQWGSMFITPYTIHMNQLAQECCYFMAMGSTPSTGIAQTLSSSVTETQPVLTIYNDVSSNKTLVLDYIKLYNTAAGTGETFSFLQIAVDTGNRWTSGGTALNIRNRTSPGNISSNASVFFGAITATAATDARRWVEFIQFKSAITIVKDLVCFNFGQSSNSTNSYFVNSSATSSTYVLNCSPITIGPGQTLLAYVFATGESGAPSWAPVISWYER